MAPLRLATRSSPLALRQAELVAAALKAAGEETELVPLVSSGDRQLSVPIDELAGRGVFTTEIEQAVLEGRADVAVHSAKDLPSSEPPPGLVLAAVPPRADPRDALVGERLVDLRPGAVVATGSVRRRAQLAAVRPDLAFRGLRGNIATRLDRLPPGGAVVVAAAALERLGLSARAAEVLPTSVLLPQVGQGALALRCRESDVTTRQRLAAIDDAVSHRCLRAERAFLARLGGGCDAPVGAYARCAGANAPVALEGLLASRDGHLLLRRRAEGDDPEALGAALADALVAHDGAILTGAVARALP